MRSVLNKLIILLVILASWVTYDNWDRISSLSLFSVKDAVQHSMPSISSEPKKSKVYQWEDVKGKVHVSNTPPKDAKNVKIIEYKDDLNVIPGNPPERKKKPRIKMQSPNSKSNTNVFTQYSTSIDQARQVQESMNQRNNTLQERLQ